MTRRWTIGAVALAALLAGGPVKGDVVYLRPGAEDDLKLEPEMLIRSHNAIRCRILRILPSLDDPRAIVVEPLVERGNRARWARRPLTIDLRGVAGIDHELDSPHDLNAITGIGATPADSGWLVRFIRDGNVERDPVVFGLRDPQLRPTQRGGAPTCDVPSLVRDLLTAAALDRAGLLSQGPPGQRRSNELRARIQGVLQLLCDPEALAAHCRVDPGEADRATTRGRRLQAVAQEARGQVVRSVELAVFDRTTYSGATAQVSGRVAPTAHHGGDGDLSVDPSLIAEQALEVLERTESVWAQRLKAAEVDPLAERETQAFVDALSALARTPATGAGSDARIHASHARSRDARRSASGSTPLRTRALGLLTSLSPTSGLRKALLHVLEHGAPEEREFARQALAVHGYGSGPELTTALDELFRVATQEPGDTLSETDRRYAVSILAALGGQARTKTAATQAVGRDVLSRIRDVYARDQRGLGGEETSAFIAALGGLPKATRADLTEAFVEWAEGELRAVTRASSVAKTNALALEQAQRLDYEARELREIIRRVGTTP